VVHISVISTSHPPQGQGTQAVKTSTVGLVTYWAYTRAQTAYLLRLESHTVQVSSRSSSPSRHFAEFLWLFSRSLAFVYGNPLIEQTTIIPPRLIDGVIRCVSLPIEAYYGKRSVTRILLSRPTHIRGADSYYI
jgi:hypothetical protein